jgi:hypothetical protein
LNNNLITHKLEQFKKQYPQHTNKELAEKFLLDIRTIRNLARKFRLRKNRFYLKRNLPKKNGKLLHVRKIYKTVFEEYIECLCDCGKELSIKCSRLENNNIISCGCHIKNLIRYDEHKSLGFGEITGKMWQRIISHAIERNIDVTISAEDAWNVAVSQNLTCNLTKLVLEFGETPNCSLDRIDSSKGYIVGNVQWLITEVNYMKHILSQDKFIELCKIVAKEN